jgi:hypothetical protein
VDGKVYSQPVTIRPDPRNLSQGADAALGGEDDDL